MNDSTLVSIVLAAAPDLLNVKTIAITACSLLVVEQILPRLPKFPPNSTAETIVHAIGGIINIMKAFLARKKG